MKILINASNIHTGGGKTLLDSFLVSCVNSINIEFTFYVDYRYRPINHSKNIEFIYIKKYQRLFVSLSIKKKINDYSKIIYFGNLPPFIKLHKYTILVLSSRFFLERYSLKGFSSLVKSQIIFERYFFNFFIKNVDHLIVQSHTMLQLAKKNKNIKCTVEIKALGQSNNSPAKLKLINTKPNMNKFLYVASNQLYKNHSNLLFAWKYLKKYQIEPQLFFTLDDVGYNYSNVIKFIKLNKLNIKILPNLARKELLKYFDDCNILIYPSLFESYGLPLIEARNYGLNIIAAELDYVRDLIDPAETFDPHSYKSISRSVMRLLKINYQKTKIFNSEDFLNYILYEVK